MIKYLFIERHKRERQGIIKYDIMFYNLSNKIKIKISFSLKDSSNHLMLFVCEQIPIIILSLQFNNQVPILLSQMCIKIPYSVKNIRLIYKYPQDINIKT